MLENAYALVIGVAGYQQVNPLPVNVLHDAQDVAGFLADPALGGYGQGNVRLLLDGAATQHAVRAALAELATRCNADSTVLLYYSGHGGRIEQGSFAGDYLLPVDADPATDQRLAQTSIAGEEFAGLLKALPARRLLVILDCCHAGGIGYLKSTDAAPLRQGLSDAYLERLKAGRGRVIFASSRSTEASYGLAGDRNSLFTRHLLAGLQTGAGGADGLVRIFDLFEYLQPRVTGDQPLQHPVFKAEVEENFPIALSQGVTNGNEPVVTEEFRYDVYLSYVDAEPDTSWVWNKLVPQLESAGLRVAVSGDVEEPGVARVVNIERGIRQARRTVIVLSERYLGDNMAGFENVLAQTLGIQEGRYRLLPVQIEPIDFRRLPARIAMLTTLNLVHPQRAAHEVKRLIHALQQPLSDN